MRIIIDTEDASSPEEKDSLARMLAERLSEVEGASVQFEESAKPGTKSAALLDLGQFLIEVVTHSAAVGCTVALLEFLHSGRKVKLEFQPPGGEPVVIHTGSHESKVLIEALLDKYSTRSE